MSFWKCWMPRSRESIRRPCLIAPERRPAHRFAQHDILARNEVTEFYIVLHLRFGWIAGEKVVDGREYGRHRWGRRKLPACSVDRLRERTLRWATGA